jgi:hypothetical protein
MPFSLPARQDLEQALKSAFTYHPLAIAFRPVFQIRLDQVLVKEAFDIAVPKFIQWAEDHGYERAIVRMMQDAVPDNQHVVAYLDAYPEYRAALTAKQTDDLRVSLNAVITSYAQLRDFVALHLQDNLDEIVGGTPPADVTLCVPVLIRWADYFNHLPRLIHSLLACFPTNAVVENYARPLAAVVQRAGRSSPGTTINPFEECCLDGTLFINRAPLRQAIKRLTVSGTPRVVAVTGPSRSGKSHSLFFISHIAERQRKFEPLTVDLRDEAPAKFRPHMLVRSLVRLMGRNRSVTDIPREEDCSTPARWVRELADFLVGEIRDSGKVWLIVLDGFANPNLDELTREMVKELVVRAAREPLLRVVLLDYSDDLLPPEVAGRFEREPISPFTKSDLKEFFRAYARTRGEEPEEAALDEVVEDVWATVPPGGAERNEALARRAAEWIERLES